MADVNDLRARWRRLQARLGAKGRDLGFLAVLQGWSHPSRRYHTLDHLTHVLDAFERVRDAAEDPEAVELALWFHDLVYEPLVPGNEEASARKASDALLAAGLPEAFARRVHDLVLATRHDAVPRGLDARLVVDCDLSILGASAEAFDAYERGVREEYAAVPEDAWKAGRAAILAGFLARERIFSTPQFAHLEGAARENLKRAMGRLGAG